jgi:hypothetical protein
METSVRASMHNAWANNGSLDSLPVKTAAVVVNSQIFLLNFSIDCYCS